MAETTASPATAGVGTSALIWITLGCRRWVAARIAPKSKSAVSTICSCRVAQSINSASDSLPRPMVDQ
jgi:hypothetical protein